jgi:hypothetical protein
MPIAARAPECHVAATFLKGFRGVVNAVTSDVLRAVRLRGSAAVVALFYLGWSCTRVPHCSASFLSCDIGSRAGAVGGGALLKQLINKLKIKNTPRLRCKSPEVAVAQALQGIWTGGRVALQHLFDELHRVQRHALEFVPEGDLSSWDLRGEKGCTVRGSVWGL